MISEIKAHLTDGIIPFWKSLRDDEYGGYYGYMDHALNIDKRAVKGCILNSRILWFFSNAYMLLKDASLLDEAKHAFEFLKTHCIDKEYGGIFWSLNYDGSVSESTKYTYNQAFALYALSSYYDASGDEEALRLAKDVYGVIEKKCTDEKGYLEAQSREFALISNEELSENGVIADRTMNTLLHVMEAYTELYRVAPFEELKEKLCHILDVFEEHIYNPKLHRQEVFFDNDYNPIIDLHSYGHDIETAWLADRTVQILGDKDYAEKISPITEDLTQNIYNVAFDGHSLANECENGKVNEQRIWWVQAETVIGFINGYQKEPQKKEYLQAAVSEWEFIKQYVIDKRKGSEWFREVRADGTPFEESPIVEPWKCPYHNGRMCIEVIKRGIDAE